MDFSLNPHSMKLRDGLQVNVRIVFRLLRKPLYCEQPYFYCFWFRDTDLGGGEGGC